MVIVITAGVSTEKLHMHACCLVSAAAAAKHAAET